MWMTDQEYYTYTGGGGGGGGGRLRIPNFKAISFFGKTFLSTSSSNLILNSMLRLLFFRFNGF